MIGSRRLWITVFIMLISAPRLWAGTLTGEMDKIRGTVDDEFVYTLTANGSVSGKPKFPEIAGVAVSEAGTSSNFSIINGSINKEAVYRYVLSVEKEGQYTIPSLSLKVDGEELKTLPITFTVSAQAPVGEKAESPLFVERELEKTTVFVGEPVVGTVRVYHKVPLLQASADVEATPGIKREAVEGEKTYNKLVNGQNYRVIEMKEVFIPQSPGKKNLAPFKLIAVVPDPKGPSPRRPESFFDNFFDRTRRVKRQARSQEVALEVLPLPTPAPRNFAGLVGSFTLEAGVSTKDLNVGDTATLTITLHGRGITAGVASPTIAPGSGFKVYEDKASGEDTLEPSQGYIGTRTFTYAIVPTRPGTIQLPPIEMSAFDPQQKKYVTLSATIPVLKVTGEAKPEAAPLSENKDKVKEAVAALADDIVPLRRQVRLWSQVFGPKDAVYAGAAVFFALLSVGGLRFNQRWRERRDERRRVSAKARAAREAARGVTALRRRIDTLTQTVVVNELRQIAARYFTARFEHAGAAVTVGDLPRLLPQGPQYGELCERGARLLNSLDEWEFGGKELTPDGANQWCDLFRQWVEDLG